MKLPGLDKTARGRRIEQALASAGFVALPGFLLFSAVLDKYV